MAYRVLVVTVVAVHFEFLALVIVGGFVALRWPRMIWAHLAAVAWAVMIVTRPLLVCPLTAAENWARRRAGMSSYQGGFIDRYVKGVLYPSRYTLEVQILIGLLVVGSWVLAWRRHHPTRPVPAADPPLSDPMSIEM